MFVKRVKTNCRKTKLMIECLISFPIEKIYKIHKIRRRKKKSSKKKNVKVCIKPGIPAQEDLTNCESIFILDPYSNQTPYEIKCSKLNPELNNNLAPAGFGKTVDLTQPFVWLNDVLNLPCTTSEESDHENMEPAIISEWNTKNTDDDAIEIVEIEQTDDASGKEVVAEVIIDSAALDYEISVDNPHPQLVEPNDSCVPLQEEPRNSSTSVPEPKVSSTSAPAEPKDSPDGKKKMRKRRNELNYVDKTYKGINKIEEDQKIFERNCELYWNPERKLTRGLVKQAAEGGAEVKTEEKKRRGVKKPRLDGSVPENVTSPIKFQKGQMVWGYMQGWWPALSIDPEDVGMTTVDKEAQYIFWIGDYKISEMQIKRVKPFSEKLGVFVSVLNNTKIPNKRSRIFETTVEMLYQKFREVVSTRTRPFGRWVEKNFTEQKMKKRMDTATYYPFLDKIQRTLDELKEENISKMAQFLLKEEKKQSSLTSSKPPKDNAGVVSPNVYVPTLNGCLELKDQKSGTIVWSKLCGHRWWPAVIIDFQDGGLKEPMFRHQWVMWYGDFKISEVGLDLFRDFRSGFLTLSNLKVTIKKWQEKVDCKMEDDKSIKNQEFRTAVLQAAKDYYAKYGLETYDWTIKDLLRWVKSKKILTEKPSQHLYSNVIREHLLKLKLSVHLGVREEEIKKSSSWKKVRSGTLEIGKICLMCLSTTGVVREHPVFMGKLCTECFNNYLPSLFTYGSDGKYYFCALCNSSGTVILCSKPSCPLVYCIACIKYVISPNKYKQILMQDPWHCFFCEDQLSDGLVRPRADWETNIRSLIKSPPPNTILPLVNNDGSKNKIRVLSLFDGISTGLLALEQLKIEVEVYYASEIDPDAINVSHMNYPQIKQIGDVRLVDDKMLAAMLPIDLLLGGSPCNDLSIANPQRKGLDDPTGTGILFYEYLRIKKSLERSNKGRHLFWMFENVASMPEKYREKISKCFGRGPDVIDSAQFSAQHRVRLYWNNLPIGLAAGKSPDLQEMLDPYCERLALVKKIRTVTTCTNSLREGKGHSLKPILMKGEFDVLRISELERIFGLPAHFTDANINLRVRHRLIGKSWSVPTIRAILQPLCKYFKQVEDEL